MAKDELVYVPTNDAEELAKYIVENNLGYYFDPSVFPKVLSLMNAISVLRYEEAARAVCEYCATNHKAEEWKGKWYHTDVGIVREFDDPDFQEFPAQRCAASAIHALKSPLSDSKGRNDVQQG